MQAQSQSDMTEAQARYLRTNPFSTVGDVCPHGAPYEPTSSFPGARDGCEECSEVEEALDDIPEYTFQEAISALRAAPPVDDLAFHPFQPVRLTRQPARRLAMQIADQRLREAGVLRADRRRLMFNKRERIFNFSDLARQMLNTERVTIP